MIYFSGAQTTEHLQLMADLSVAGIVDAFWLRNPNMIRWIYDNPDIAIGLVNDYAQSKVSRNEYADFISENGNLFAWCSNMGVLKNQQTSNLNWRFFQSKSADTLWLFQVAGGVPFQHMRVYAGMLGFIGIAGMAPLLAQSPTAAYKYMDKIGKVLCHEGAKAHFFDTYSPELLQRFGNESWFDSFDVRIFDTAPLENFRQAIQSTLHWVSDVAPKQLETN